MVDDVTRYHRLYEAAITDAMPARVSFAANGEEGLQALTAGEGFDLLILDLNMPKMGGEEVLRRLRQDHHFDTMPVIILTGDTAPDTHRRLLDLGADDFIEKGAAPEIFVARLKAQLRHRVALDRLARMAVDMDVFAAGVLHDIRNLETSIVSICHLVSAQLDDDPVKNQTSILNDLDSLGRQASRLGTYANEIIRIVRDTNRPLDLQPQDLSKIMEWVFEVLGAQGSQTSWKSEKPLEPILADQQFLKLALFNLVQNSIKYRSPDRPPHMTLSQVTIADPTGNKSRIVTRFRDNGRGVNPEDLRKIFEPFVRGERQPGDRKGGFGLGLALVTKVVNMMGGNIWAELPEDGQPGTIFCLELPSAKNYSKQEAP